MAQVQNLQSSDILFFTSDLSAIRNAVARYPGETREEA
jgi:hypothetical protein